MRHALLLSIALTLPAPAASGAELPTERRAALDAFIGQFAELAMFDGTVLVDLGGELVYEGSFGLASYEHGVGHDAATRFRIASLSKTLTDAAFAVLIQRGELALDTPLSRYLPGFPQAEKITIGHLLSHRSGIPHSNRQPWGDAKTSLTLDEIVARLAALPLDFEPGTSTAYSNGGYAVAAKVLEVAGGAPFREVVRRTVLEPLGMKDSGHVTDSRAPIARMATGYEPGGFPGERRHSRFYAVETRPGGGSAYSTAHDMLAFARGVFRRDFVSPELRRSVLGAGDGAFLSQGRSPGCVAKLLYDPEIDAIVVSLANNYAVPADWARAIADLATGRVESSPWGELQPADPTVAGDDPRLGRYGSSRGGVQIIERGPRGAMFIEDEESESVTGLVPLADGSFLHPLYFQRCRQEPGTRAITCHILSGDERYSTELEPLAEESAGG